MTSLKDAAMLALSAGVSVLPPREDGTKAPLGNTWKHWQRERADEQQILKWYTGDRCGLGVVTGAISGNLELIDFDETETFLAYKEAARLSGLEPLLDRVLIGYHERTPFGVHTFYRCSTIEGNQKLATRPKVEAEKRDANDKVKTLIETRGEGGFVVVAPSNGKVHPTGRAYEIVSGSFASVVTITPGERESLLDLARTFHVGAPVVARDTPQAESDDPWDVADRETRKGGPGNVKPGDDFTVRTTWKEVLEPHGWKTVYEANGETYWRRPGKDEGISATSNYKGSDLFYCFSSSTPFTINEGYSRWRAYAVLEHKGDWKAAAKALAAKGYGSSSRQSSTSVTTGDPWGSAIERPTIKMRHEFIDVAHDAETVLISSGSEIFVRSGSLVRLTRDGLGPRIDPLPIKALKALMAQHAMWFATKVLKDGEKVDVRITPPNDIVDTLATLGTWNFPEIEAVVVAPTMRPDGSVLDTPGYDPRTKLLYAPNATFPAIKEKPTLDDARMALEELHEPFAEFPFTNPSDRSAALALPITILGRGAFTGATPLYLIRATIAGTGKQLLAEIVSTMVLGYAPPTFAAPREDAEWEKKLCTHVRDGDRFTVIDEAKHLDSPVLSHAITQEYLTARLLGSNSNVRGRMPVLASCGNQTTFGHDLGRRIVPIELDPRRSDPELRSGFRIKDVPAWTLEHRPRLVACALTVLRAYIVAGRPEQNLSAMGSFEGWSRLVRSALAWCGLADPALGQYRVRAEADVGADDHLALLRAWHGACLSDHHTVRELADVANMMGPRGYVNGELRDLLLGLDEKQRDTLKPQRLGYALRRMKNRMVGGFALRSSATKLGHDNSLTWHVERLPEASPPIAAQSPLVSPPITLFHNSLLNKDIEYAEEVVCGDAAIKDDSCQPEPLHSLPPESVETHKAGLGVGKSSLASPETATSYYSGISYERGDSPAVSSGDSAVPESPREPNDESGGW